jgi:DNA-binding transcriptional MerR regulator
MCGMPDIKKKFCVHELRYKGYSIHQIDKMTKLCRGSTIKELFFILK